MAIIETTAIAERQVEWTPKGWDWSSRKLVIVRNGGIKEMPLLDYYFLNKDIDGAIEFLQAIKRAMKESKTNG